jgi:hypothetical protein
MDGDIINTKLARALLSKRQFEILLTLERQRFDERGPAIWLPEECPEILREIDRELRDGEGPGDERAPEFR